MRSMIVLWFFFFFSFSFSFPSCIGAIPEQPPEEDNRSNLPEEGGPRQKEPSSKGTNH